MKKTPTIFKRNKENMREITREPNPDCEWVFNGEGVATRKYDGTFCLVKRGKLYKRRELKLGKQIPEGFEIADYDNVTGKTVGWMPVKNTQQDRWHMEAFGNVTSLNDGTYELCGPKVQGNPERLKDHLLIPHAEADKYYNTPRSYIGLRDFLEDMDIEGLAFHHEDGRMAKINKRDFGQMRIYAS